MLFKDRVKIAFRNIVAGSKMSKKIVYGMTFVFMILFCSVVVINSYLSYMNDYDQEHIKDCYYYSEFQSDQVTEIWVKELFDYCQREKERYQANTVSVFCTLQLQESEDRLWAKNVKIRSGKKDYSAENYFIYKRKPYQNIHGETSDIEIALYKDETAMFAEEKNAQNDAGYLIGRYPGNPGEIMLDTYILDVFDIKDATESLLGEKISLCSFNEQSEEVILEEYLLTGILNETVFTERESMAASDYHFEHIYINPQREDLEQFQISRGSIRYYFNNYQDYVENYNPIKELFGADNSMSESDDLRLTQNGSEFCIVYWIMHNLGGILLFAAGIIVIINTLSFFYIFQFYRDRNADYLLMLQSIGMEKKDRRWIFFIEICSMMAIATLIGSYLAAIILVLFNFITKPVINFSVVIDLKSVLLSFLFSWMYFGLALSLVMRKKQHAPFLRECLPAQSDPTDNTPNNRRPYNE